jgi:hypothetical protein
MAAVFVPGTASPPVALLMLSQPVRSPRQGLGCAPAGANHCHGSYRTADRSAAGVRIHKTVLSCRIYRKKESADYRGFFPVTVGLAG